MSHYFCGKQLLPCLSRNKTKNAFQHSVSNVHAKCALYLHILVNLKRNSFLCKANCTYTHFLIIFTVLSVFFTHSLSLLFICSKPDGRPFFIFKKSDITSSVLINLLLCKCFSASSTFNQMSFMDAIRFTQSNYAQIISND